MTTEATETTAAETSVNTSVSAGLLGEQQQTTPESKGEALFEKSTEQAPAETKPAESKPAEPEGFKVPGEDAKPEAWDAFYKQLGRPDKAEDYKLPLPEGDKGEFAKAISPALHAAGLTQKQAETLANGWNEYVAAQTKAMTEQAAQQQAQEKAAYETKMQAEADALKKEWGASFDANKEMAQRAVRQFIPKEQASAVIGALEREIGTKATIQMLHAIGKGLAEDDASGISGNGQNQVKSAAQVLFGKP